MSYTPRRANKLTEISPTSQHIEVFDTVLLNMHYVAKMEELPSDKLFDRYTCISNNQLKQWNASRSTWNTLLNFSAEGLARTVARVEHLAELERVNNYKLVTVSALLDLKDSLSKSTLDFHVATHSIDIKTVTNWNAVPQLYEAVFRSNAKSNQVVETTYHGNKKFIKIYGTVVIPHSWNKDEFIPFAVPFPNRRFNVVLTTSAVRGSALKVGLSLDDQEGNPHGILIGIEGKYNFSNNQPYNLIHFIATGW